MANMMMKSILCIITKKACSAFNIKAMLHQFKKIKTFNYL
ncbi:hypothetical protein N480_06120 [Pseudoalteromonas luteoviolacea S2607]|uniref:Uncharacterized protein n=1 Tax=Pseudoalteromonas luteoviolacea S4060-1 TaxID=1365257 RepID=A0A161YJ98_9GAMM|nr:hypothetical protein N480_06120 [Pseudoalteromonas luteoviolacea S2607]KZN61290.1 hypothetical protein N478_04295 [Pseudoalteromonas luteoviolacea S4060-1]